MKWLLPNNSPKTTQR